MNQQPKILVYRPSSADQYASVIRQSGYEHVETASTEEEARAKLSGVEIIFAWRFPTELLMQPEAQTVRWIQSMGAGVDDLVGNSNFPKQVICTRIVNQFGSPIAEYVFAYLLYLTKDIPRIHHAQTKHRWDPFLTPFLAGRSIGVAGLGSIGKEIVRKARAFDMTVYGLSQGRRQAALVDHHFTANQWLHFVRDLDILVLTLPLTQATRGIVNQEILQGMKPGAWLLNVGRGALVSEPDLLAAVQEGQVGAAVLDVFATEPLPASSPFWDMSNVYVTPHLSGPSLSEGVSQFFLGNLRRYVVGEALEGRVDLAAEY